MARLVPYLPLNLRLPRPTGDENAEGMKKPSSDNKMKGRLSACMLRVCCWVTANQARADESPQAVRLLTPMVRLQGRTV